MKKILVIAIACILLLSSMLMAGGSSLQKEQKTPTNEITKLQLKETIQEKLSGLGLLGILKTFLEKIRSIFSQNPIEDPAVIQLYAGQNIDVGEVQIWNDDTNIYVKYIIDAADWCMTETHVHIGMTEDDFPMTKTGNPQVGHFDYQATHDCVTTYMYTIPLANLGDWDCDQVVYIATHAVVIQKEESCDTIVSDTSVDWSADGMIWYDAVECWVHTSWADITGAPWIWRTVNTDVIWEYDNVPDGGWYFKKEFDVTGTPISADISINADNTYELYVNGVMIGSEGSMNKDGPDFHEWGTIDNYSLSNIVTGANTILVRALNFFRTGSSTSNPAGLAFKAEVCSEIIYAEETAWGDGPNFPGKNWATYFAYTITCNGGNGDCQEETAFGGETAGGGTQGWWFYFDTAGADTQTIWAGQTIDVGEVYVGPDVGGWVSITIDLQDGWDLQEVSEPVKIEGYNYGDLPTDRPNAGWFTYKGTDLEWSVPAFDCYVIHLDVQLCP